MPRKENIIDEFSSKTIYKQNFFYGEFTNNQINEDYFNINLEKNKFQRIIYEVMILTYYLYELLSGISSNKDIIVIFVGSIISINMILFSLIYFKFPFVKFFLELKSIVNICSFIIIIFMISVFEREGPFKSIVRNFFYQNVLIILDTMFFSKYYSYFKIICISCIYFIVLYFSNYNLFTISINQVNSSFIAKLDYSCSKFIMSNDYELESKDIINYQKQILAANIFVLFEYKQKLNDIFPKANEVFPKKFESEINVNKDEVFIEYSDYLE